ncbi:hypothetical protein DY000_02015157 [Brassica cretica]|uniref:Uncharacterized protein n=1 Tax=Brassica cretica TaxID=69181 RepID=A0ABQ7D210_BRACR|nr:hypothetical protein DY000_02015157 [Brassica cretica]
MESLQPIQLGSTKSYLWEPGNHLNQSGGIPEVLSCTRTHRIRRILEEFLKPTRSHLWKDWTIFRFNLFQANQFRPEDIKTKPKLSEDIMHEPEEFYEFISCTSPHRIMRIIINTKLSYLEQTDINVQQIFFYQAMNEIRTFQSVKKVPRKLSYPLKPSSTQIERVNQFVPSYHQIERFNQALIRISTSSPSIDQAESVIQPAA